MTLVAEAATGKDAINLFVVHQSARHSKVARRIGAHQERTISANLALKTPTPEKRLVMINRSKLPDGRYTEAIASV
jgi:hypothetical protein